jgi:hypothetical protein
MEKEIFKGKISKKIFIIPGIFATLFFIEAIIFIYAGGIGPGIIPLILSVLIITPALIKYSCTSLILLDKKIIGKTGFLSKETLDAPLDKINDVYLNQGIFGRLFNYGKINISTSSNSFYFKGIDTPELFKNKILEQIEIYKKEQVKEQAKLMAEALKNSNN